MCQDDPIAFWCNLHDLRFYLNRISLACETQEIHDPDHMCIYNNCRDLEGSPEYAVCRFPTDTGKSQQLIHRSWDLPAKFLYDDQACSLYRPGFLIVVAR